MIYLTDAAGQCVYTSAEWEKLTGQGCEETRGRGWLVRVHPDNRAIVERILDDAAQRAAEFNIRYRLLKPDDTCRWIAAGGVPSFGARGDAFVGYIGTITELAEGAVDTIGAYGKVERYRAPAPHPATMPSDALDLVADHLLIAHSLIEAGSRMDALADIRKALFKVGQALAERMSEKGRLN
ncbi:PAS domain-containing protein [Methylobacterium sp. J-068]|uniref:PAS domain-containing protein n=1 Tax=Methylobacterium sp. J-068 TaxID=2836649 RepID=UPI001FBB55DB|nr:PAS domain-containing protein [Methylobacterium sp. J-068]MCJ2033261.1 PAS domain-containing protein [Methylobacterium sp. J-068]